MPIAGASVFPVGVASFAFLVVASKSNLIWLTSDSRICIIILFHAKKNEPS